MMVLGPGRSVDVRLISGAHQVNPFRSRKLTDPLEPLVEDPDMDETRIEDVLQRPRIQAEDD